MSKDTRFSIHDWQAKRRLSEVSEHHNDEDFPGKDLSAWDLLDKMKTSQPELYKSVEDFMKQMDENITGGGAVVSTGPSGTGPFATPNAFKKKRK